MKIKTKILFEFLKKVTLNKKLNTLILNFNKKGLEITHNEPSMFLQYAFLDKKHFINYNEIGKVKINKLNKLTKILENSCKSKEIELSFNSKNKICYELIIKFEKSILKKKLQISDDFLFLNFNNIIENIKFNFKETIKKIKATKINKGNRHFQSCILNIDQNKLNFIFYNFRKKNETISLEELKEKDNNRLTLKLSIEHNYKTKYSFGLQDYFFHIINNFDEENLTLYLNEDLNSPYCISFNTKYGDFKYLLAKQEVEK